MARKSRRCKEVSIQEPVEEIKNVQRIPTAIYARLSVENNGREDEESLISQISLIRTYIANHSEYELIDTYTDNGYTGTDFDRPGFKRLIDDITRGKVSCVVVKDLSRFGRNYVEAGMYIETIFPKLNVRLIAINDHFDSFNEDDRNSISVPMKNMINEMYSRDHSRKTLLVNKLRCSKKESIPACKPPYGYIKNETGTKYVPDPRTSDYVRMAYLWRSIGVSLAEVTERLGLIGAPRPGEGSKYKSNGRWSDSTVSSILSSSVYTGDVRYGMYVNRIDVFKRIPEDQWILHKDVHEPLATIYDYESVKKLNDARSFKKNGIDFHDRLGCFKGIIYCKECNRPIFAKTVRNYYKSRCDYEFVRLECSPSRSYDNHCNNFISEEFLKSVIMENIRAYLKIMTDKAEVIKKAMISDDGKNLFISIDKKISSAMASVEYEKEKQARLYEDFRTGFIDKDDYEVINHKSSEKIAILENRLKELRCKKDENVRAINNYLSMIENLNTNPDEDGFDPELVRKLISRIDITRDKRVEITFKTDDICSIVDTVLGDK